MIEAAKVTQDALLGGRVRFHQARDGYRAGMDAILLAAACDAKPGDRVLDVGCGAGAVMLAAATRLAETRFVGIERDPAALSLALQNIALNGFTDRMEAILGDVAQPFSNLGLQPVDAALCNPPFFDDPSALRGPAPAKAGAWLADAGLEGWIGFLIKAVREGGTITLIHRADRLGDILSLFAPKVGSIQIRPIHPFANAPAKRVLVRGVKTGKAPLKVLPGFVLHDRNGDKHTAEADALLLGDALPWT
jgi:tRNA1(Val) A37 N6-methylase TrmN6